MSYINSFQISFLYRYMNFSARNICVALLASVLGIYLLMPRAIAASHCTGATCLHCNEKMFSVNASATKVVFDEHLCDISFGNSPCNLKSSSNPNAAAAITSSTNMYRQVTGPLSGFTGSYAFLFQNLGENDKAARFHIASGTIPIYLQNLSLLC
jgi:hypothetical protein